MPVRRPCCHGAAAVLCAAARRQDRATLGGLGLRDMLRALPLPLPLPAHRSIRSCTPRPLIRDQCGVERLTLEVLHSALEQAVECVALRTRTTSAACGKCKRTRSTTFRACSTSSMATTITRAPAAPAVRSRPGRVASPWKAGPAEAEDPVQPQLHQRRQRMPVHRARPDHETCRPQRAWFGGHVDDVVGVARASA